MLHALTFGVFWGCAVETMQRTVPARLRATGQAMFSAVVFGAGNAVGYALSGAGYDRFGSAAPLYASAAVVELLPLLLLLLPLSPEQSDAWLARRLAKARRSGSAAATGPKREAPPTIWYHSGVAGPRGTPR